MPRYNGGFIGHDGLDAPDAPSIDSVTAGNEQVSVAFTAGTAGTTATTGFVAQVSANGTDYSGGSATGSSSPITVSSLTNGTSYTAKVWAVNAHGTSEPSSASSSFTPVVPERAIHAGGNNSDPLNLNVIQFLDINSSGNTSDFGDLVRQRGGGAFGLGSSTRGVVGGGAGSGGADMDYITIASTGNASDFGDMETYQSSTNSSARDELGGGGNETRGIITGTAFLSGNNKIDYITIASTGNTTNFGDTTASSSDNQARGAGSTTRFIFGGFQSNRDQAEYVTIASTGNATTFGDLGTDNFSNSAVVSSATRCVWMGGQNRTDNIKFVTIASTGNASDFGTLSAAKNQPAGASNKTKGLAMGGQLSSGRTNVIEQITIASTGNATDYGDLTEAIRNGAGLSNAHGGLS